MADILAVLYGDVMAYDPAQPLWQGRDRLIVSKGHAAAIVYAVLADRGFFPTEDLATYGKAASHLVGHIVSRVPGIEVSTGSLGHGLPIACGTALATRTANGQPKTYVILSDGELDEGSNWEAILFAAHHRLSNLVAIIDYNKIQSFGSVVDVLALEPLAAKFEAFSWRAIEVDGHNIPALCKAFVTVAEDRPTVIIAHTIKGKGVSFMENRLEWHYKSPSREQLKAALAELEL